MLFGVEEIGATLLFETRYIVLPACANFVGTLTSLYHFANVGAACKFVKEWCEELVANFQVVVGIDYIL